MLYIELKYDWFRKGAHHIDLMFSVVTCDINKRIHRISVLVLSRLLMRVHILLRKKRHWRRKSLQDSTSMPQLQDGFNVSRQLCLTLCSREWLGSRRILVTNFMPMVFWQLKIEVENNSWKFCSWNSFIDWPNRF